MSDEVCVDVDMIEWALERIGKGEQGCPFEPLSFDDPDHHGREFAAALFDALVTERREHDALVASLRNAPQ